MVYPEKSMNKGSLILLLGALAALGPLSIDMYLPSFPDVERDLQTNSSMVGATLATFFAGLCLGQVIYGPMSDKIGRKRPLMLGVGIYLIASIGCLFATNIEALMALRFLQALGACAGMVVGRAMIRDLFDPTETARVFSLVILTMGVAPILAPILGQFIADFAGWRGIFGFMVLFSCLVGAAVFRLLPADRPEQNQENRDPLWKKFGVVLQDRNFVAFALSGTFIQGGLYAYITGSPTLFMDDLHLSSKAFSILFGVNASGLILASQLNTWLLRRHSYQAVLQRSLQVAAVAAILLALMGLGDVGGRWVAVPLFVFISSLGLVFPNSTAGALAEQGRQAGTASAVLGVIQYGGAAVASGTVGLLHHFTHAPLQLTMGACGVLSIVVFHWLVASPATAGRPAIAT